MTPRPVRGGDTGHGRGTGPGGRTASWAGRGRRWRLVRADRDAIPPSVRRFMRRARQRRLRAALPWAAAGALAVLALLATWVVYGTTVFGVRQVRVVGVELVSPDQVRQAAAVPEGTPLARVDLAAVRERVAALAPVDRVRVRRDWPATVVVEVVERTGVATVPQGGRFVVVDAAGVVFRVLPTRPEGLPVLRVGTPGPADVQTRAGLKTLEALSSELRGQLVEVVVQGPAGIRLRLRAGRTVIWGDETQGEEKARVATSLLSRGGNVIDVSAPGVVSFR